MESRQQPHVLKNDTLNELSIGIRDRIDYNAPGARNKTGKRILDDSKVKNYENVSSQANCHV
jgi:hypothetical protein